MSNPYDPSHHNGEYDPNGGWGQPQYTGPQQQPPYDQYGQPQYGQAQYGPQPQQYGPPVFPLGGEQPPKSGKGRTRGIIAAAAAVVVIGGGVGSYVAFSSSSNAAGGASSPKAAVQTLVSDIDNTDVLGMLDDLAPGERDAIAKPFQQQFADLKRDGIINSGASPSHLDGVRFSASGLTYGTPKVINDHVDVVPLTGGTIHVSADATKLPLTKQFLQMIDSGKFSGPTKISKSVNIATVEKRTGKPVEIATQLVDGKWYPSLFYTIANYATMAAHVSAPSTSLPAVGASSADDAVRSMVTDLLSGRIKQAIELTSPTELQVLHDYGSLIVAKAHYDPAPLHIRSIQFNDTAISGGTRVSLKSLTAQVGGTQTIKLSIANNCLNVTAQGQHQKFCAARALALLQESGKQLTGAQRAAITHLFSAVSSIGVDTSETDGQWYVNPVRTYADLSGEILGRLQKGDFEALISLARP